MTKVFLSYDRDDQAAASKIATALEKAGHEVWWDRHIRGGSQYAQEIERALAEAGAVVVLWSERSIHSAWVRDEAAAGRDSGRLIPVRIDACTPPLGFRQYQTIDLPNALKPRGRTDFAALADTVANVSGAAPPEGASRDRGDPPTRRSFLIGAGAVTAVAAGAGGLYLARVRQAEDSPPPEIAPLLAQAKQMMDQNTRDGQNQALGLYQRAVQIAPNYPNAWGWLGYTYGILSHNRERSEAVTLRAKAEAAGRHALDLDSHNQIGELALAVALPLVGPWAERESRLLKALASGPQDDLLNIMAVSLQFVGRSSEAIGYYQRIKHKPFTPAEYTNFIHALWSSGRLAELDQAIGDAAALYPTQGSLWYARAEIAIYGGLTRAVAALSDDPQARPSNVSDADVVEYKRLAALIAGGGQSEADAIVAEGRKSARAFTLPAEEAIKSASALGRLDDAFAIANAYYFNTGFVIPDLPSSSSVSLDQRETRFLFQPPAKRMRADPRFEKLVKDLGFDAYWRQSGKPPDYRRKLGL